MFRFYSQVCWKGKIHKLLIFFFLFIKSKSELLAWIGWSVRISKQPKILSFFISEDRFWFPQILFQNSQTSVSCTTPHGSPSVSIHISYWVTFVLVCYIRFYYHFSPLNVFHTSISWWFLTGVWVTASLHKSPGLFSVFWPILMIV